VKSYALAQFLKPVDFNRNLKKCANCVTVVQLCDMISQLQTAYWITELSVCYIVWYVFIKPHTAEVSRDMAKTCGFKMEYTEVISYTEVTL